MTYEFSDDTRSTSSSGFGSYADFQSQAELYPTSIIKDKQTYAKENEDLEKSKGGHVQKEYSGIKRYGGMLLTVAASVAFSFVTLMVKVLQNYGADQYGSSFWR